MPLSDAAIREAKPRDKAYKLSDSEGLYLQVSTSGAKLWRWKYRIHGKEKKLAIPPRLASTFGARLQSTKPPIGQCSM